MKPKIKKPKQEFNFFTILGKIKWFKPFYK
jgi:hypothetical protein